MRDYFIAVMLCLSSAPVHAQHGIPYIPPPPPCSPAEPIGCYGWTLIEKGHGVVVATKVEDVKTVEKKGRWVMVGACNCFWGPCGNVPPRRVCHPAPTYQYSRQEQTCWKVEGDVSFEGKTGLLARLIGELGVTVQFGGEFQKCTTVTETLTFPIHQSDCWRHKARDVWKEREVRGVVVEAETANYWECQLANRLVVTVRTECGLRESKGEASTIGSITIQSAPLPPCAGGPNPTPAEYDGELAEKCCAPLPQCDPVPAGGHPCCGCYGSIQ